MILCWIVNIFNKPASGFLKVLFSNMKIHYSTHSVLDEDDIEVGLSIQPPPVSTKKRKHHKKHKTGKEEKKKKRHKKENVVKVEGVYYFSVV